MINSAQTDEAAWSMPLESDPASAVKQDETPYIPSGSEEQLFAAAQECGLPVMLTGPTGCGKTKFVQWMARRLGRPLITVACHDDLSAADLVGRYLLHDGETRWFDGPLTRAVRSGAICYLDEIVEARHDTTVVLHPVADHRRELHIERLGVTLTAPPEFQLVVSYNPGYQSVLKDLKESTRQRMIMISLGFPEPSTELDILCQETRLARSEAAELVSLGQAIRRGGRAELREVASTRALVSAARLIAAGVERRQAARAAISGPLSDEPAVRAGLDELIDSYLSG